MNHIMIILRREILIYCELTSDHIVAMQILSAYKHAFEIWPEQNVGTYSMYHIVPKIYK